MKRRNIKLRFALFFAGVVAGLAAALSVHVPVLQALAVAGCVAAAGTFAALWGFEDEVLYPPRLADGGPPIMALPMICFVLSAAGLAENAALAVAVAVIVSVIGGYSVASGFCDNERADRKIAKRPSVATLLENWIIPPM